MLNGSVRRRSAGLLLGLLPVAGCQSPAETGGDRVGSAATVAESCPSTGCAATCLADAECPSGQHCKAGTCGADCTPGGTECGAATCGVDGRCSAAPQALPLPAVPSEVLIDDMGVVEGRVDAGPCIEVVTGFETVIPTVLLLIDRSLSMDEPLPNLDENGDPQPGGGNQGGPSRWDTVRDILAAPGMGLIERLQADVRFGLSLYTAEQEMGGMGTNPGGMNPGGMNPMFGQGGGGFQFGQGGTGVGQAGGGFQFGQGGAGFGQAGFGVQMQEMPAAGGSGFGGATVSPTPATTSAAGAGPVAMDPVEPSGPACPLLVDVPIALDNYDAIYATYSMNEPLYTTPTAASVIAATTTLSAVTEEGPKILILATDGEPGDCNYPFVQANVGSDENRAASVQAVTDAFAVGIETYVISVGDVGRDHLEDLAQAGSSDPAAAPYTPGSEAALEQAFLDIIGQAQSCTFNLQGEVPSTHAGDGEVTLNGLPLVFEDANGWRMPDPSTVEVLGTACEQIQNGTGEINISFPCIPSNEISR